MKFIQHRLFATIVGFALALILLQVLDTSAWLQVRAVSISPPIPASRICNPGACQGHYYGSNYSWMQASFPSTGQLQGNWCGIANIQAIELYDFKKVGSTPLYTQQQQIANLLNSNNAISPWGHPSKSIFKANISLDSGTDPRAIEYGLYVTTPANFYFHNIIYPEDNDSATRGFAFDWGSNTNNPGTQNDPISVTISQGAHSFVVAGVYTSSDPSQGGSYTFYGIDTWDPWLSSADHGFDGNKYYNQYQNTVWSFADWKSKETGYIQGLGPSYLWALPYNTHANNGYDPEPSSPVYYYTPPFPNHHNTHWGAFYVTIEQDNISDPNRDYNHSLYPDYSLTPHN